MSKKQVNLEVDTMEISEYKDKFKSVAVKYHHDHNPNNCRIEEKAERIVLFGNARDPTSTGLRVDEEGNLFSYQEFAGDVDGWYSDFEEIPVTEEDCKSHLVDLILKELEK